MDLPQTNTATKARTTNQPAPIANVNDSGLSRLVNSGDLREKLWVCVTYFQDMNKMLKDGLLYELLMKIAYKTNYAIHTVYAD